MNGLWRVTAFVVVLLLAWPAAVQAQGRPVYPAQVGPMFEGAVGGPPGPPIGALGIEGAMIGGEMLPGRAAFLSQLFPPRQVMLHQQDIDLRPAQAEAIKKVVTEAQEQLVDIQWRLDGETSTLGKLVAADHVDEAAALAKLQEVAAIEQEMKNVNFTLLVRIKNQLDPEQQSKLRMLSPPAFGVRVFSAPVPAP